MIRRLESFINYNLVCMTFGYQAAEYGFNKGEYAYNELLNYFENLYPFITVEEFKEEIILAIYIEFFENRIKVIQMKDILLNDFDKEDKKMLQKIENNITLALKNTILKDVPSILLENRVFENTTTNVIESFETLNSNIRNNKIESVYKDIDFDKVMKSIRYLDYLSIKYGYEDTDDFFEEICIPANKKIIKAGNLSKNYNLEKENLVKSIYFLRKDTIKASNERNKTAETIFEKIDSNKLKTIRVKELKERYFDDILDVYEGLKKEIDNNNLESIIKFIILERRYNIDFLLEQTDSVMDFYGEEKEEIVEFLKKFKDTNFFIYRKKISNRIINKNRLDLLIDIENIKNLDRILKEIVSRFSKSQILSDINDIEEIINPTIIDSLLKEIRDSNLEKYSYYDNKNFKELKKLLC